MVTSLTVSLILESPLLLTPLLPTPLPRRECAHDYVTVLTVCTPFCGTRTSFSPPPPSAPPSAPLALHVNVNEH